MSSGRGRMGSSGNPGEKGGKGNEVGAVMDTWWRFGVDDNLDEVIG